ncbi:hypothetical protein [Mesorhizobium sp. M0991]
MSKNILNCLAALSLIGLVSVAGYQNVLSIGYGQGTIFQAAP